MSNNNNNSRNLSSPDITMFKYDFLQAQLLNKGWQKLPICIQKRKDAYSPRELKDDSFVVFYRKEKVHHNLIRIREKIDTIINPKSDEKNMKIWPLFPSGQKTPNYTYQLKASREKADKIIDDIFRQNPYGNQTNFDGRTFFNQPSLVENESSEIGVLKDMRNEEPSFVIGFDTEFYYTVDGVASEVITNEDCKENRVRRHILSWQFCFVTPDDPDILHELIVFGGDKRHGLSIKRVLGYIIETFKIYQMFKNVDEYGVVPRDIRSWTVPIRTSKGTYVRKTFTSYEKALEKCSCVPEFHDALFRLGPDKRAGSVYNNLGEPVADNTVYVESMKEYLPVGYDVSKKSWNGKSISVTLVCHSGKADLTTFAEDGLDIVSHMKNVQGGLCSIGNININVPVYTMRRSGRFYPVSLCVRDTMCFTPGGDKSLASIGKAIGVEKIEIDTAKYSKGNMLKFIRRDPVAFCEYAINDAVICLTYSGILWNFNKYMPITTANAAVKASVLTIMKTCGCKDKADFNKRFRGLKSSDLGLVDSETGFIKNFALIPLNDQCGRLQKFARDSYNGGYNGSMMIGYFPKMTYDYDLMNAYPTIMSVIPDVNWIHEDLIYFSKTNFDLTEEMVSSPFELKFAYGTFEFPEDVDYPCIPVKVGGCITYPRKCNEGVYMACPEIYLAIKLGAKIHADTFICARHISRKAGEKTSLFKVVERFINDRSLAGEIYGPKSVLALLMKESVNSIYGKCAQNVIEKKTWSAKDNKMVEIGDSQITSPVMASLITSGVRSILLAAINELSSLGYNVYSVTTDGFISDAPFDVVKSLNLYGLDFKLRCARFDLVRDGSVWQVKHEQNDLINLTTRGNISLSLNGVNAHNSYRTGEVSDSVEDRLAYENAVMNRDGKVISKEVRFTSFRNLSSKDNRSDFVVTSKIRKISMDFDFKRKPLRETLKATYSKIVIKNGEHVRIPCESTDPDAQEIACISTAPYEDPKEYLFYKEIASQMICLRTVEDWHHFFNRVDEKIKQMSMPKVSNNVDEHSILYSCLIAYRQRVPLKLLGNKPADIPFFETKGLNNKKRAEWVNKFSVYSGDVITESDWDNAKRPARLKYMLPEEYFIGVLKKMMESC